MISDIILSLLPQTSSPKLLPNCINSPLIDHEPPLETIHSSLASLPLPLNHSSSMTTPQTLHVQDKSPATPHLSAGKRPQHPRCVHSCAVADQREGSQTATSLVHYMPGHPAGWVPRQGQIQLEKRHALHPHSPAIGTPQLPRPCPSYRHTRCPTDRLRRLQHALLSQKHRHSSARW